MDDYTRSFMPDAHTRDLFAEDRRELRLAHDQLRETLGSKTIAPAEQTDLLVVQHNYYSNERGATQTAIGYALCLPTAQRLVTRHALENLRTLASWQTGSQPRHPHEVARIDVATRVSIDDVGCAARHEEVDDEFYSIEQRRLDVA